MSLCNNLVRKKRNFIDERTSYIWRWTFVLLILCLLSAVHKQCYSSFFFLSSNFLCVVRSDSAKKKIAIFPICCISNKELNILMRWSAAFSFLPKFFSCELYCQGVHLDTHTRGILQDTKADSLSDELKRWVHWESWSFRYILLRWSERNFAWCFFARVFLFSCDRLYFLVQCCAFACVNQNLINYSIFNTLLKAWNWNDILTEHRCVFEIIQTNIHLPTHERSRRQRVIVSYDRIRPLRMLVPSVDSVHRRKISWSHKFTKHEIKSIELESISLLIKIAKKKVPTCSINSILWNSLLIGSWNSRIYRM